MAATVDYWQFQKDQSPAFVGLEGENWFVFWGHLKDAFAEAAKDAVKARFPSLAAVDALEAQAADRNNERYPAESEELFRVRLAETFDRYQWLGTPPGVIAAVEQTPGVTDVVYREAWQWDPGSPLWARFWVVLATTWELPVAWGDPGETWGGGRLWGLSTSRESVAFLRRQVRRWKAAHAKCAGLLVKIGDATVWGEPDRTWGGGRTWGAGKVTVLEA
jgi:hypothetical protein